MTQRIIKKLCVFGSHEESELYSRNRTLVEAMSACALEVVTVSPGTRGSRPVSNHGRVHSMSALFRTAIESLGDLGSLALQRGKLRGSDCCFVAYPAYLDMVLLRFLFPGRRRPKFVVDAFLCLHDTVVNDRRMIASGSVLARLVRWLEGWTLRTADLVFIDTERQRNSLINDYDLDDNRLIVVPVGIDESLWQPLPPALPRNPFTALFWGTFIPLHGVETVVRAAHILQAEHPDIRIELVGDGQTADAVASLIEELQLTNVHWTRSLLPGAELRSRLESAHCVLGIFGASDKAGNVIPYKAYQALASNRVLITRKSPAFTDLLGSESVPGLLLVPSSDPEALAIAIADLHEHYSDIYQKVATRELYDRCLGVGTVRKRVAEGVARL